MFLLRAPLQSFDSVLYSAIIRMQQTGHGGVPVESTQVG